MTAIVSLSGGLDSTATALKAVQKHGAANVRAFGMDYGQRHVRELESAVAVADHLGIEFSTIDLNGLLTRGESLVEGGAVPEGHYAKDTMSATVVLGRNLMFVSALLGQAAPEDELWVGVHGGDHFIYPDCRPSFFEPLATAIRAAYSVDVMAPWIRSDKTEIARFLGGEDQFLTSMTWSCYQGGDLHCGRCGTCVERAEAFALAETNDPTDYEDPNYWREAVAEHEAAQ